MMKNNYSFDGFTVYEGNEVAHAAMYEAACRPDKHRYLLYIYSSTGLGKTHLVNAAVAKMCMTGKVSNIIVTTAERFGNEYIYALSKQVLQETYDEYESADILIMENLQQLSINENIQHGLQEIFDMLHESGRLIILTADVPPEQLEGFDKSLLSKIMSGYVVEIKPPFFETRMEILEIEMERIIEERQINLELEEQEEICSLIANSETSDIRKMKGLLNRVIGFAALLDETLNLEFAKKILQEYNR